MSVLQNTSIDQRQVTLDNGEAVPLGVALGMFLEYEPDLPALRRAATQFLSASPAMIEDAAQWLFAEAQLRDAGCSDQELFEIHIRAATQVYDGVFGAGAPVLLAALLRVPAETVEAMADALLTVEAPQHSAVVLGELAMVAMAAQGAIPERFDRLLQFKTHWHYTHQLLEALPEDRRQKCLEFLLDEPFSRTNALWRARHALRFVDFMDDDRRGQLEARIQAIAEMPDDEDDEDPVPGLLAALNAGFVPPADQIRGEDGLTDDVRDALSYWTEKIAERRLKDALAPIAEARLDLAIEVDAPELASLAQWVACDEARKVAIAKRVEKAGAELELQFMGLESYDRDAPALKIATFRIGTSGMLLSLVPGGTYLRGFSEREENLVRASAEANKDIGNWYEEYQFLLDQAPCMRPVVQVTVQPFLVFQLPSDCIDPADITVMFESMPFRLLTEAEHEYASRGGRASQLTWRGDGIANEIWLEEVMEQGPELKNPFGLALLGLHPEVLSDVWAPDYEGAPVDGSARTGPGSRVARGGAAMVYPWQSCGEWHLLTNALRCPSDQWEFFLSMRPAMGVRLA